MSSDSRFGPDGFPANLPEFPAKAYSFYTRVAAEARRASQLYWSRYKHRKPKDKHPAEGEGDRMNGEAQK